AGSAPALHRGDRPGVRGAARERGGRPAVAPDARRPREGPLQPPPAAAGLALGRLAAEAGAGAGRPLSQESEVRGQKSEVSGQGQGQESEGGSQRRRVVATEQSESSLIRSAKDLIVYQRAYSQAMRIFQVSKGFPREEVYSLTSQVRRSSRSVCLNLREAWAKRRYPSHFVSKLSDSDAENSETETSLDFALDCGYLQPHEHEELVNECQEIGRMLGAMIR